ncbi:MAG: hypothetical protein PHN88_14335 [Ignavibacteria bacterium]|nr:hypothetical protein [Ignavibacteria bacterium]
MDKILLKEIDYESDNSQTLGTKIKIAISINDIDYKYESIAIPFHEIIDPQIGFIRRYNFKIYSFNLGDEKSIKFTVTHYIRFYNCYNESKLIDLEFRTDNIDFVQCYYIDINNSVHLLSEYERPFKELYDQFIRSFPLTAIYNKLYDYQYPYFDRENNKVIYNKINNYEIRGLLKDIINSEDNNFKSYKETADKYLKDLELLMKDNNYIVDEKLSEILRCISIKFPNEKLCFEISEMANGVIRFDANRVYEMLDNILLNNGSVGFYYNVPELVDAGLYKTQLNEYLSLKNK